MKHAFKLACGCTKRAFVQGGENARLRAAAKLAHRYCERCLVRGSSLDGSTKQIAWAEDIRRERDDQIRAEHERVVSEVKRRPGARNPENAAAFAAAIAAADQKLSEILGEKSAAAWIEGHWNRAEEQFYAVVEPILNARAS